MSLTAATSAKQRTGQLLPLPQPISALLSTRVHKASDLGGQLQALRSKLTAMQGTLLPQLQTQATMMNFGVPGCNTASQKSPKETFSV